MRTLLLLLALLGPAALLAQEICDNGLDDDGDGLIDLQDPDCKCTGIYTMGDVTSYLPNPSFEDFSCCPSNFSEMGCVDAWGNGNFATTDYSHTCGFMLAALPASGLLPFPDGNGVVGAIYSDGWKEYLSSCLNEPFLPGLDYTLSFQIGFAGVNNNGSFCSGPQGFAPVLVTLYGNSGCGNLTINGTGCPDGVDGWFVLGTGLYTPFGGWSDLSIQFKPTTTVSAIMLGPPCSLPPGYSGSPCYAYILYDDLTCIGEEKVEELDLTTSGLPCDLNFTFFADINHQGGNWQWYFNGIALPGQNDPAFPVSENNYQSGTYQVVYSTPDGCVMDSVSVTIPPRDTAVVEVIFCPGSSISCAGETFFQPGEFEVHLMSSQGCDSVVACIVTEYELVPPTMLEYDTCGPVAIPVCGDVFSNTGYYEIYCSDYRGCDSLVILDLRVMTPQAIIQPVGVLDCDASASVLLNGLASPINPLPTGSTTYEWSGPFGGFNSGLDQPTAIAIKPGKYCLTMIFENNGIECRDSACVIVTSTQALPAAPLLQGGGSGCVGDTLYFQAQHTGSVPSTGFEWLLPPGHFSFSPHDSSLQLILTQADSFQVCVRALSECGFSDPTCLQGVAHPVHQINLQSSTCDPQAAGTFTASLTNQFGCDSTVTHVVTLSPSSQTVLQYTTCIPQEAGTDTLLLTNQYGCDSIVIHITTLLPSQWIERTFYTCDAQQAGIDTLWLTNQFGCDSTIVDLYIYTGIYQNTQVVPICGTGTNYADTLLISAGPCDSLFITAYQYISPDTTWLQALTCDPGQVGLQAQVLTGQAGCDSLILTQVSLAPRHDIFLEERTCDLAAAGTQVIPLLNQYGCDSIVTIQTLYVGIDTQFVQSYSCDSLTLGQTTLVLPGPWCDTIWIIQTDWLPFSQSLDIQVRCQPSGPAADTLLLLNSYGCDSLAIRQYVYVDLQAEGLVFPERCAGDRDGWIEITSVSGGMEPLTYQLNGGLGQSSPRFDNLAPGNYTVVVEEARGCRDTLSGWLVGAGILVTIDAGPDRTADKGTSLELYATANSPLTLLQWSALDPLSCSDCIKPRIGPLTSSQSVQVTGYTADGCKATDQLYITVRTRPEVYIPGSFSPNLDGINDIFSIYGNDQVIGVRNLAIYDRWGNALYSRQDLPINDPSAGWNGTFRDQPMDPGVYVYVVEVVFADGQIQLYKGDVTLVK